MADQCFLFAGGEEAVEEEANIAPPPLPTVLYDEGTEEEETIAQLQKRVVEMCGRVFRVLGPGFREAAYQKAVAVELNEAGLPYMLEAPVVFHYKGYGVGVGYADIVVQNRLVLELKSTLTPIQPAHVNQCRGYMRGMHIQHGLVINFPQYRTRDQAIDVFDCHLGINYPTAELDSDFVERADLLGPNAPHFDGLPYEPVSYLDNGKRSREELEVRLDAPGAVTVKRR